MKIIRRILYVLLVVPMLHSCAIDDENTALDHEEPVKDISGSWQVVSASRNGSELTNVVDFSKFRINFAEDHTYSFENYLPFVVAEDGTYSLDDPEYPFTIRFKSQSGENVSLKFNFPIVEGKRQIGMSFSTGCSQNSYTYVIQRVNP